MPRIPMLRVPHLMHLAPLETKDSLPMEEALSRVVSFHRNQNGLQISFLQTKVSIPSVFHISANDSSWLGQIKNLENCHPSWAIYKPVARFLENPSRNSLAERT